MLTICMRVSAVAMTQSVGSEDLAPFPTLLCSGIKLRPSVFTASVWTHSATLPASQELKMCFARHTSAKEVALCSSRIFPYHSTSVKDVEQIFIE